MKRRKEGTLQNNIENIHNQNQINHESFYNRLQEFLSACWWHRVLLTTKMTEAGGLKIQGLPGLPGEFKPDQAT